MLATLLLASCACAAAPGETINAITPAASTSLSGQGGASTAVPPRSAMVIIGPPTGPSGKEITRAADGLFYVTAIVNGAPIRFLVDTGASLIVLRPEDARMAGVWSEDRAFNQTADTAGGRTAMARVVLDEVVVGDTRHRSLNAAVVQSGLTVSLLGQNWLAQLASLTISGNRMLFN